MNPTSLSISTDKDAGGSEEYGVGDSVDNIEFDSLFERIVNDSSDDIVDSDSEGASNVGDCAEFSLAEELLLFFSCSASADAQRTIYCKF